MSSKAVGVIAIEDANLLAVLPLILLFLVIPIAELVVIFQVAHSFGWLETIAALLVISFVGAALVRHQGVSTLIRIQQGLSRGEIPTKALVDGLVILLAGALMLTPGFLTDIIGVLLLVPPVRAGVRTLLIRRYRRRLSQFGHGRGGRRGGVHWTAVTVDADVVDVAADDTPRRSGTTGELER
jgi:UPF0716 protein FxsA